MHLLRKHLRKAVRYKTRSGRVLRNINMRSLPLVIVLLCMLSAAQVQTQESANTLKLCGRAFLRAVVFNCGGSRWRRFMGEEDTFPEVNREANLLKWIDVSVMERQLRDQNAALMRTCCQQGCQKSDLSMLC
ncbi:relaxin-3-like [Astatotilapia calliptera]|uniref:Insulin-like domain-containing protein n=1 Tax=Astatotilapia calliptera TaxID=8154 RepID=A0A3P8PN75_ASTCA|nr:relaxin-3-like [Astatotilapia calliptera]